MTYVGKEDREKEMGKEMQGRVSHINPVSLLQ